MFASRLRRTVLALLVLACAAGALTALIAHPASPRPVAVSRVAQATAPTPHHILFVGASYTAGIGASAPEFGYAPVTARALGWSARVDAVPGTGYVNPGPPSDGHPGDGTFAARLARLAPDPAPNILVLQGGRNDIGCPAPELRAAIQRTVALAKSRFRPAHIVLLGPIPATLPPDHGELAVAHELAVVAGATGVTFIDPIAEGWINVHNQRGYVGDVPAHPDDAGYAYIAKRLVIDLDQLLGAKPESTDTASHAAS